MPHLNLNRLQDTYPGTGMEASKGEYASFKQALKAIRVKLKHDKNTAGKYSAAVGITLPAKNPDLATLTDEYLHAWNDYFGRGKFLPVVAARNHLAVYQMAVDLYQSTGKGTSALKDGFERTFHQLEALNFIAAPEYKPKFLERVLPDLFRWAHGWKRDYPGGTPI